MGASHTVLVRSDGTAVAFGNNNGGQCRVPALPDGISYIAGASGGEHSLLLRSDGQVVAFGSQGNGRCQVPPLPEGCRYTAVAAGHNHSVLLRSDGRAVAFGRNADGCCTVPPPPEGRRYVAVAAGGDYSVLLLDDGSAVAFGKNDNGRCDVPALQEGEHYVGVAAGAVTVLLREDGQAMVVGRTGPQLFGNVPIDIPAPPPGVRYIAAATVLQHCVLVRDDGQAVAVGNTGNNRCNVPALAQDGGLSYVGVTVGTEHTILVRSDGKAVAFGKPDGGRLLVPELPEGVTYLPPNGGLAQRGGPTRLVSVRPEERDGSWQLVCTSLSGEEIAVIAPGTDRLGEVSLGELQQAVRQAGNHQGMLQLIWTDGRPLVGPGSRTLREVLEKPIARLGNSWTSGGPAGAARMVMQGPTEPADDDAAARQQWDNTREELLRILGHFGLRTVPGEAVDDLLRWKLGASLPATNRPFPA